MDSMITTNPFQKPALEDVPPRPARLEIVEVHDGDAFGPGIPLMPNTVRINGMRVWCPEDQPIAVDEITVSGDLTEPLVVRLKLMARRLTIGEAPTRLSPAEAGGKTACATVEVPYGDDGSAPYVVIDGHKLSIAEPGLTVHPVNTDRAAGDDRLLLVTVPLICRSIVFDDEITGRPAPQVGLVAPSGVPVDA